MSKIRQPKILFFDIETMYLKARVWQPGQQYVGHASLEESHKMWDLICIQYCWDDGKPVKVLRYDKHGGTKGIIEKFDKLIKKADVVVGKNSDRFDIKMLNSLRMYHGLPGIPDWHKYADDLEKQMRRHFRLPSQSLDYISSLCGVGGKIKMEMADWIAISNYRDLEKYREGLDAKGLRFISNHLFSASPAQVRKLGRERLEKMCTYGAKDTEDTRVLWHRLKEHFTPRFNMATFNNIAHACITCGSENIEKDDDIRIASKTRYQSFYCNDHGGYAGRAPLGKKGVIGKMG